MHKARNKVLVIYAIAAIAVSSLLFAFVYQPVREWDMVSKEDIRSPDGRYVATVFEMCSYDTTGYWPQISLRRPGQELGETGNVLSCGPGGRITAQWLSSRHLAVELETYEEWTPPATTNIDEVKITFSKLPIHPR